MTPSVVVHDLNVRRADVGPYLGPSREHCNWLAFAERYPVDNYLAPDDFARGDLHGAVVLLWKTRCAFVTPNVRGESTGDADDLVARDHARLPDQGARLVASALDRKASV